MVLSNSFSTSIRVIFLSRTASNKMEATTDLVPKPICVTIMIATSIISIISGSPEGDRFISVASRAISKALRINSNSFFFVKSSDNCFHSLYFSIIFLRSFSVIFPSVVLSKFIFGSILQ